MSEEIKKTEVNSTSTKTIEVNSSKTEVKSEKTNDRKNASRRPQRRTKGNFQRRPQEFEERVVNVSRVTTVVKGGRRFSFSVLVVIGDKKGRVGYGHGKANEVPDAIKKSIKDAKRNLIRVPIIDKRTIPHEITSKYIASKVMIKPAPEGKGIIASGTVRSVVELAGYKDIVTKSLGSSNKTNVVKATLKALSELKTIEQVAKLRNIKLEEVLG